MRRLETTDRNATLRRLTEDAANQYGDAEDFEAMSLHQVKDDYCEPGRWTTYLEWSAGEPPYNQPPMIPVISPAATGTPEAIAIPMQSGNATRKTTIEARKSLLKVRDRSLTPRISFSVVRVRFSHFIF